MGSLCSDCGRQKAEQDLFQDFLQTAEKVMRDTDKGFRTTKLATGMWMGLLACMAAFMLLLSFTEGDFSNFLVLLVCISGVLAILLFQLNLALSGRRRRAVNKASEIDKSKPGFLIFYEAYDSKTFKEEVNDLISIGKNFFLSFAGNVAGSIAQDEMEASRQARLRSTISQAVDDELKRHNL
jgi:hypothetical protein